MCHLNPSFDSIPLENNKRRVILWYNGMDGKRNYLLLWVEKGNKP